MAKTKPIGVRFDEEMLSDLKLSPQKALNFLTDYFYAPKKSEKEKKEKDESSDIENQIAAIRKEVVPKERDTPIGRRIWMNDQERKINDFKRLLK